MRKVILYSLLLVLGLGLSQALPHLGAGVHEPLRHVIRLLTMVGLAFIMIHVGLEFELDKNNLRRYGWDYVVAATAAAFPWLLATLYFVFVLAPPEQWGEAQLWKEGLLQGRFASPTSAGVLFSMLAAAGLGASWVFRKARVLAIFDDLDTILLMIPLQMVLVGFRWQLLAVVASMAVMLWAAWRYLHQWRMPHRWPWVLGYATALALASELLFLASGWMDPTSPIHFEVLLPAFVLGCVMRQPAHAHDNDAEEGQEPGLGDPPEQRAATVVSACFMVLVGLSMPALGGLLAAAGTQVQEGGGSSVSWGGVALHVLVVTLLINLGKMFPAFCYRREASRRERLALAIALFPRGEVGAGVLVISLGYGIGGMSTVVAMLALALNLLLTGVFIVAVKRLISRTRGTPPLQATTSRERPPRLSGRFAGGATASAGAGGRE
ncbi:cation:proton antiporter [Hyalangium gracile]|uniref:cation:proton antiporter n=1 Tax=Hyalangium gracile TaxID=394092 RepID=UPI001CCC5F97|nr:cation:proton antiporter [Hyalangium gracile]